MFQNTFIFSLLENNNTEDCHKLLINNQFTCVGKAVQALQDKPLVHVELKAIPQEYEDISIFATSYGC